MKIKVFFFTIISVFLLFGIYGIFVGERVELGPAINEYELVQGSLLAFFALPFLMAFNWFEQSTSYGMWDSDFEYISYKASHIFVYVWAAAFVAWILLGVFFGYEMMNPFEGLFS